MTKDWDIWEETQEVVGKFRKAQGKEGGGWEWEWEKGYGEKVRVECGGGGREEGECDCPGLECTQPVFVATNEDIKPKKLKYRIDYQNVFRGEDWVYSYVLCTLWYSVYIRAYR